MLLLVVGDTPMEARFTTVVSKMQGDKLEARDDYATVNHTLHHKRLYFCGYHGYVVPYKQSAYYE